MGGGPPRDVRRLAPGRRPRPFMDPPQTNTATIAEAETPWPSSRYRWLLLAMLLPATIFEGYDITIFHLCTPDITATFHLSDATVGTIAATVRAGGLLSFFVVTLADRFGRKRI